MSEGARYVKIVEWSDEDQCFVGSCPGLFYAGCHGDDEQAVFAELCELVEQAIDLYKREGKTTTTTHCRQRLCQQDADRSLAWTLSWPALHRN
jgi:predicted RNase H-like HicB family nuclease